MQPLNRARRGRRIVLATMPLVAGCATIVGVLVPRAPAAFADSQPFEEYCPGTPVGDIALNNATATATITPASPASGQQFNVTNFQVTVNLPSNIVGAAAALGNSAITGQAIAQIDATGATPANIKSSPYPINAPIPSPVPAAGLNLLLPATPTTVGPFTASGGPITLTLDSSAQISVTVSGSSLNLTCTAYPNNTVPSGIVTAKPTGSATAPQLATATASGGGGGGGAAPAATTTPPPSSGASSGTTPTTAAPAASPSMAFTGPGPHLWLIALVGFIVIYLGAVVLALVDDPRRRFRRILAFATPTGAFRLHRSRPDTMVPPWVSAPVAPVAPVETGLVQEPPAEAPHAATRHFETPAPAAARPPSSEALWHEGGLWASGWEPGRRRG
jgi:hypothetical protein